MSMHHQPTRPACGLLPGREECATWASMVVTRCTPSEPDSVLHPHSHLILDALCHIRAPHSPPACGLLPCREPKGCFGCTYQQTGRTCCQNRKPGVLTPVPCRESKGGVSPTYMQTHRQNTAPGQEARGTHRLPCREEYATWASMIVTQFGRIPGAGNAASGAIPGFSSSPQRHVSPAMGHLQHYYQVSDPEAELHLHPGTLPPLQSPCIGVCEQCLCFLLWFLGC